MLKPLFGKQAVIDGRKVHYLEVGEGRTTIVLLHGFGSLAQEIAAPFAAETDVKFLAFDRPGYGFSDPLPVGPGTGPASQAKWLAEILEAFGERNCILVAHSMGAAVALWLAARRPDLVSRLLLLAPFCRPTRKLGVGFLHAAMQPGIGPLISERLVPSMAGRVGPFFLRSALFPQPVPKHLEDFPFAHVGRPGALRVMARDYTGFQSEMAEFDRRQDLRARITVLFGTEDRIARPEWHLDWISGLNASIEVDMMPGIGHAPHHARPDTVRTSIRNLL
jgi:pimeloyl-ACP methyl ester carboxylesterase